MKFFIMYSFSGSRHFFSLSYLLTYLLTYLVTYLLTYLLTYSLTHSLTHSLTLWCRILFENYLRANCKR